MKKCICISVVICILFALCGCGNTGEKVDFSQQVTIVKMMPSPKYKTTQNVNLAEKVFDVLEQIKKSPIDSSGAAEYDFIVKISIDGEELVYKIGNLFTDADATQYKVENYEIIINELIDIYGEINGQEQDYV